MGDSGSVKPHFFFDNCTPCNLARMLSKFFEHEHVIHHIQDDNELRTNDEDVLIIKTLADRDPKPFLISADVNMYTRVPEERLALSDSGLTCVFFMKNTQNGNNHDFASKVFKLWPELVKTVTGVRHPTIFEINSGVRHLDRCCLTSEVRHWKRSSR